MRPSRCRGISRTEKMDSTLAGMSGSFRDWLSAVAPQDLGGDVLAARGEAFGAQLRPGQQAVRGEFPGMGGQAVPLPVRVAELGSDVPGSQVVEVGRAAAHW